MERNECQKEDFTLIGVDTNVLLRFLIADDPEQYERSKQFLYENASNEKNRISNIVLMEVVWVLGRSYGQAEATIVNALEMLLSVPSIEFEGVGAVTQVTRNKMPLSMLADMLIAESNLIAGCGSTVTFDKKAASHIPGMELLA